MANAAEIDFGSLVKGVYVGTSGAGKTGSLISLLRAGYKIRLLDMDSNSVPLVKLCKNEDPTLLRNLGIIKVSDKFRTSQFTGIEVAGQPKALVNMLGFLNKWDDGSEPAKWGKDYVLCIDTLTAVGSAALNWAKGMSPTAKDPRQWYAAGQAPLTNMLEMLAQDSFDTNVLVMSHIEMIELNDGTSKGFPSALGKALSPKVAKNFPNIFVAEAKVRGSDYVRKIHTVPTSMIDGKNADPAAVQKSYDLNTGLAEIFAALSGRKPGSDAKA